jgi:hypothetical protein
VLQSKEVDIQRHSRIISEKGRIFVQLKYKRKNTDKNKQKRNSLIRKEDSSEYYQGNEKSKKKKK